MTRHDLVVSVTARLTPHPFASQDAHALVAHVTGVSTESLLAFPDLPVLPFESFAARRAARQRARGVPLAYILRERWFYGRRFRVTPNVLIPRPETELLVDLVRPLVEKDAVFVDVGTGSGALAVTLAAEFCRPVTALDTSRAALCVARRNAKQHGVDDQITFQKSNLLSAFTLPANTPSSHLILLANLPYLTATEYRDVSKTPHGNELPFEPCRALVADADDGLSLYRHLLEQLALRRGEFPTHLTCLFEVNPTQTDALADTCRLTFPDVHVQIKNDLSGRPRCVLFTHIR